MYYMEENALQGQRGTQSDAGCTDMMRDCFTAAVPGCRTVAGQHDPSSVHSEDEIRNPLLFLGKICCMDDHNEGGPSMIREEGRAMLDVSA